MYELKYKGKLVKFANLNKFINWRKNNQGVLMTEDQDIIKLDNFLTFYQKVKKKCEQGLDKFNDELLNNENNPIIKNALEKFVFHNADGKFLRATLVALGYQTGKQDDNYLPLALAVEIFQTSILIHDDIIDKSLKRRGKDTIPVLYKKEYKVQDIDDLANSMVLCLGDLGFFLASSFILKQYKNYPNIGKLLNYYNDMVIKTCKGEMLDVFLPFKEQYINQSENLENQVFEIYTLKTAWYSVIGPFCLGLVLGNASDDVINKFEKCLLNVGIAFQIKDDLLGIYGNEEKIGKSLSDAEEYKQTILYSYTLKTEYKDDLLKYYGTNNYDKIRTIFTESGAKKYAEDKMNSLFKEAIASLNEYPLLVGFTHYLKAREK